MAKKNKRTRGQSSEIFLDSLAFRIGTRVFVGLIVVVIFLTLTQCTVRKPESPQWTTNLTVPVISRTYPMSELVWRIDQDGIQMLGDSQIVYSITQDIDTIRLSQTELSTPNIDTTFAQVIGIVNVSPPSPPPVTLNLTDLFPVITFIPDTTLTINNNLAPIASFSTATIASGIVYIVIANNLAVSLDSITITLNDIINPLVPVLITTQALPGTIIDGATDSVALDLAGKTISNSMQISVTMHTPGGTSLRAGTKEITTSANFNGPLSITSATNAAVPSVTVADTSNFQLGANGDTDIIQKAGLATGSLQLTITNNTRLNSTLNIQLPDILQNSLPLVVQQVVAPLSNQIITIDLTPYDIVPSDQTAPQMLPLLFSVVTDSNQVDIDQSDDFSVRAAMTSLSFDSVTGIFSSASAPITPTTQAINIPQGFDAVQLAAATLTLRIDNAVQLPGSLNITVSGNNGNTLNMAGTILAATATGPVTTILIDSSAASFLSPLPDTITFTGVAFFGDGTTSGTLTSSDFVHASVELLSPLEMIINPTTVQLDVDSTKIDSSSIDLVTDHVQSLRFIYSIDNSLPLGVTANIYLSQAPGLSASVNQLNITGLSVAAAPTGGGGLSTGISSSLDTVLLTNADVQILNTDSLYILTTFDLAGTSGLAVKLLPTDSIRVVGRLEVEYLFDGKF